MSREVKVNFLKSVLEFPYNQFNFQKFIKELLKEPYMFQGRSSKKISLEYEKHIRDYTLIAKYEDNEDKNLIALSVCLKNSHSVEHARTLQRNFVSKILEQQNCDAAIVAFYSIEEMNWRLSFVSLDYTFSDQGLELDLTPARRFSYLVGVGEPSHTAQAQLIPVIENDKENPLLDEIEKAFSVEKVTKEFFDLYKEKYLQLKDYLEKDTEFVNEANKLGFEVSKFAEQFSKKLLGQLSFLYFIQKKGWLGVRILPENHTLSNEEYNLIFIQNDEPRRKVLDKVFTKLENGNMRIVPNVLMSLTNHETELLSDCFINTRFNQQWGSGERKFINTIFRNCIKTNKNFFDDYLEPLFYTALNKKRKNHYFNQFNCKIPFLNGGLFEPLEGYHWRDVNFNIPNYLFSNEKEFGREADGILDIFERFNFTMNEDEPLEKEVAVDPEMLGKIFENLLDVQDRKSKGAFYTPREIVHYMCQESLVNYLVNEVDLPYDDIREFILYGDLIRDMDSRSEAIKKERFRIKPTVHNNIIKIDKALSSIKIADPAVGSGAFPLGLLSEIVKIRNNITEYLVWLDRAGKLNRNIGEEKIRKSRLPYELKRETIKNSIFAVDIEPSAVDITKLRLWLSVVVDQEINESNPDPKPLPNLDMNILVGNSLIDEFEGIKLFDEGILYRDKVKNKAIAKESDFAQQLNLLLDDSEKMLDDMFKLQDLYFDEENEETKKKLKLKIDNLQDHLIEYKLEYDKNYIGLQKYKEFKIIKQKPYFLWYLEFAKVFKEKGGFDIVIGNPPYGAKLDTKQKKYIKSQLIDTNNLNTAAIFIDFSKNRWINEKGTLTFIVPKSLLYSEKWFSLVENLSKGTRELVDVEKAFEKVKLEQVFFTYSKPLNLKKYHARKFINDNFVNSIYVPISTVNDLKAWLCDVKQEEFEVLTNLNIDHVKLSEISITKRGIGVQKNIKEDEGDYEVIGGRNIKRFKTSGIKGYLSKEIVENFTEKLKFLMQPKIISQDLVAHVQNPKPHILITSTFDKLGTIIGLDTVQNTIITNEEYQYEYILGLLNSTFISWYTYKFIYCSAVRTMHFDNNYVGKIPIPKIDKLQQSTIIDIVNKLMMENVLESQTVVLKKELDDEVYKIFGINEIERNIIEK